MFIYIYQYLKCLFNLFVVDGSTSPGSKMQIEMDVTSSRSSLSFDTYNYQYTRGIDVQQVIIRNCLICSTSSDFPNSICEYTLVDLYTPSFQPHFGHSKLLFLFSFMTNSKSYFRSVDLVI